MKVLTSAQMKAAEAGAVLSGSSYFFLMERAGLGAADAVQRLIPMEGRSCLLFCGRGNNGGDGFIAAVRFQELGAKVAVVLTDGYPTTREAKEAYDRVVEADLPVALYSGNEEKIRQLCGHTDVIVDAIYGTGFRLPLDEPHREICQLINRSICAVVALDLPTGVCADTGEADPQAVRADFTAVFHAYKPAHLTDPSLPLCGRLLPVEIGIPEDLPAEEGPVHLLTDRELVAEQFPPRPGRATKGTSVICSVWWAATGTWAPRSWRRREQPEPGRAMCRSPRLPRSAGLWPSGCPAASSFPWREAARSSCPPWRRR